MADNKLRSWLLAKAEERALIEDVRNGEVTPAKLSGRVQIVERAYAEARGSAEK